MARIREIMCIPFFFLLSCSLSYLSLIATYLLPLRKSTKKNVIQRASKDCIFTSKVPSGLRIRDTSFQEVRTLLYNKKRYGAYFNNILPLHSQILKLILKSDKRFTSSSGTPIPMQCVTMRSNSSSAKGSFSRL